MELPDSIAVAAGLAPVVRDSKQAVVAESDRGRVRRITSGAADYTHRQPIQLASGQSSVARSIELLVGDLLFGRRIVAAVAGVDQLITEVLVVDVATRDHDGVGTFSTVSRDAPISGRCTCAWLRAAREAKVEPMGLPGTSPKSFAMTSPFPERILTPGTSAGLHPSMSMATAYALASRPRPEPRSAASCHPRATSDGQPRC